MIIALFLFIYNMDNIKSLPALIRKGGVVAIYTTCGLGLVMLPSSESLKRHFPDLIKLAESREISLLIGAKTPLNIYLSEIPEIAMTLLELSDKAVTLQFEEWNKISGIIDFFPQGLAIRMVTNKDESYIVNGVGQPLLFIPITQKELSNCKSLKGDDFLFELAFQEQQQRVVEKPGIIRFFVNGSMKIIRE